MNTNFENLKETARRAFYWTSFSPDKRGDTARHEFYELMLQDVKEIETSGADTEQIEAYKKRFEQFFVSWLNANSRCASTMITGSANFNVRKHEKANKSERNHYEAFMLWREKAKKAIVRKSKPETTFLSEIERYKAELLSMQQNHEAMKEGNKRISKAVKTGEDITDYLKTTFNIPQHMIEWTMKFGFGLQNNNANMKRVEQRIKELESKEKMRVEKPESEFNFTGGKIVINYEVDRIQIFFDSRPSQSELTELKSKGLSSFNWSPSNTCWQRKITPNAIWSTKRMFNL